MAPETDELESEVADLCGVINAATARLVGLIGRVLETEAWHGAGILSPEQWAAWKCAVSRANADVAAFAEHATVSQLRRTLAEYTWPEPEGEAEREERRVGLGHLLGGRRPQRYMESHRDLRPPPSVPTIASICE